jgi:uncharacterized protein GlcG (DUF336 family)
MTVRDHPGGVVTKTMAVLLSIFAIGVSETARADPQGLPTVATLTLAIAQAGATAANAACTRQGFATTSSVVDASGTVIAQLRNDGATAATVDVSKGKAYAAAAFKTPTDQLRDAARTNPGFTSIPNFVILAGGLPISSAGKVVGAIGVSGATSDDIDKTCAQAGLDAMGGTAGSGGGSSLPR